MLWPLHRAVAAPQPSPRNPRCLAKTRTPPLPTPPSFTAATPPISKTSTAAIEADPDCGRRRMAGLFRGPEGRARTTERDGALLEASRTGRRCRTAIWSRRSDRRLGRGRARPSATRSRRSPGQRRRAVRRRRAAGDPRFHAGADADPRLPRARALFMPISTRSSSSRRRIVAELDPTSYGFTEADFDRPIFLDMVLGLQFGTLREIVAILQRTYCQTLGIEFMHISNAAQKGWLAGAHGRPRQEHRLHARGQARDPQQAGRGRRLRELLRRQVHRHQALRPRRRRIDDSGAGADHQARRRARRERNRASACRIAAGSTCWRR